MSDIVFDVSKTISVGDVHLTYAARRAFTSSHYDKVMENCKTAEDVEKFHYFINNELEMQLKRIITNEENT